MQAAVSKVESVECDDEGRAAKELASKGIGGVEPCSRREVMDANAQISRGTETWLMPRVHSVFKAANAALEPAFCVFPHPLDHSRVIVAISEIMVERGEAVLLASLLHSVQLVAVKCELVDIAPIVGRGIHREAGRHSTVRADDHVVLPGTAVPFAKAELSILTLHDPSSFLQLFGSFSVRSISVPVPADVTNVEAG